MTIQVLPRGSHWFPPVHEADEQGVVAVGGDYSPERMLAAYQRGIFPWPIRGVPVPVWFAPDPRCVLDARHAHVGRSLRKSMRTGGLAVRADERFRDVVNACAEARRPGQRGTWLTLALRRGLEDLHRLGVAHSVEAYRGSELVGGLYGVSLGGAFFGESMFAREPDASKIAFATLLAHLVEWQMPLVDCQVHTEHLERFGAVEIPRERFQALLAEALRCPTRSGPWRFHLSPAEAEARLPRS